MEKKFEEILGDKEKKLGRNLTDEEVYYMLVQATNKEASLRGDITDRLFGEPLDVAHNLYTYLSYKDSVGKKGIQKMKSEMTTEHLKNSFYYFARNEYNGNIRKKKNQNLLYNTISLDKEINDGEDQTGEVIDVVSDEKSNLSYTDSDLTVLHLFNSISNEIDSRYIIRYADKSTKKFSFRRFAKLFYELASGVKLVAKDFNKIIYELDDTTGKYKPASEDTINKLIKEFKTNLRKNSSFNQILREV